METANKAIDETLRQHQLEKIEAQRAAIEVICQRYGVAKLSLFGSLVRSDDFSSESDIDFLVEFRPDVEHGLSFFNMELELEDLLGGKVDLNTTDWLSQHFRDQVAEEAEVFYATTAGRTAFSLCDMN